MKKHLSIILLCLITTSCLEILDDITFNIDGSGTFKYTVNLSSSQVKLNSILALDSIDGKKVPSVNEIQEKIEVFAASLSTQEGISNVYIDTNYQQFIFKIQCDFSNVMNLQRGFELSLKETMSKLENEENGIIIVDQPTNCMRLRTKSNERLEFLGDGVLECITKYYL